MDDTTDLQLTDLSSENLPDSEVKKPAGKKRKTKAAAKTKTKKPRSIKGKNVNVKLDGPDRTLDVTTDNITATDDPLIEQTTSTIVDPNDQPKDFDAKVDDPNMSTFQESVMDLTNSKDALERLKNNWNLKNPAKTKLLPVQIKDAAAAPAGQNPAVGAYDTGVAAVVAIPVETVASRRRRLKIRRSNEVGRVLGKKKRAKVGQKHFVPSSRSKKRTVNRAQDPIVVKTETEPVLQAPTGTRGGAMVNSSGHFPTNTLF